MNTFSELLRTKDKIIHTYTDESTISSKSAYDSPTTDKFLRNSYALNLLSRPNLGVLKRSQSINNQLSDIAINCNVTGWDGREATPILQNLLTLIKEFLRSLDVSINAPEITPEPNGWVGLEWKKNNNYLILRVRPDGEVGFFYETHKGDQGYGNGRIQNNQFKPNQDILFKILEENE
jgi:hypothetical protein